MTTFALDMAWGPHPSPQQIKDDGFVAVGRYLSRTPDKNITTSEARSYLDAGLDVFVVWETTADRAGQGAGAGQADVRDAEAQADAIGLPKDAAIFYAVDYDPDPAAVLAYFRAVRAGTKRKVGAYCSDAVAVALFREGLIDFFWQTESTGFRGRWPSPLAHIIQHVQYNRPKLAGDYDENIVVKPEFGQWHARPTVKPTPPQVTEEDEMILFSIKGDDREFMWAPGNDFVVYLPSNADLKLVGIDPDPAPKGRGHWGLPATHFLAKLRKVGV